jgi:hypothetical protein
MRPNNQPVGNTDPGPALDPDPANFFRGFQDANKNKFFSYCRQIFISLQREHVVLRSHKTVKDKVF